jgi:hypothetical protein
MYFATAPFTQGFNDFVIFNGMIFAGYVEKCVLVFLDGLV